MTIQEMHIEVGLASQQVASSVNRRFLPEEIDWILNKTIERFVRQAVKPKEYAGESDFEEYQIDTDKIRTLVVHDIPLPVTVSGHTYSATLPTNYAHLIEDSSFTVAECEEARTAGINGVSYISILKLKPSAGTAAPYYKDLTLKVNDKAFVEPADLPSGMEDKEQLFQVVDILRELLPSRLPETVQAYWELYGNLEVSNAFIFVSSSPISSSITYDGIGVAGALQTLAITRPQVSLKAKQVTNRLTKSDRVGKLRQSSFAKPQVTSPLSVLQGNILKVYGAESFIVTQVLISYVRKPRKVALSLSRNCNLPEETHQEICDQAVEYIKMTIQDPSYPSKLQDNKLRN